MKETLKASSPHIPDFALDMHTKQGKSKGRGIEHFFTEGNKLENEGIINSYTEKAKKLLLEAQVKSRLDAE